MKKVGKNLLNKIYLSKNKLPNYSYCKFLIEKSLKRKIYENPPTRLERQNALRIFLENTR